ncbi:MAG: helix-turn-helix domain-containing protein [Prevotellaceae bacterium]|jgi:excisionase family DNA binding protein|nr:helix-turn-helix domain-containing protein [Prevotellaceae bacterium]
MDNEVITKDNERVKTFFRSLDRMLDKIESAMTDYKPMLNGERFLTDVQVAERLKVSRRTLQEYRTEGKIPYIQFGGKTLYRESDIQKILDKNYRKAWG